MQQVEEDVESAARSDAKVLITGETGVGKDVVAHLIHQRSARVAGPLLTVNCAGLPDSLLESELFGHVRGSFTGAYRDKAGLLEMAPNGTVFLDEVGEMSLRMQVVLLRFLETGEIQRVGSDRVTKRVDVRLITATNRDLQSHISAGQFREDLYYRLNVIRLTIPPLRERVEDVPPIINHYLEVYSAKHKVPRPEMLPSTLDVLTDYRWPGNVRELKNIIERLVLKSRGRTIQLSDLPQEILRSPFAPAAVASTSEVKPRHNTVVESLVSRMIEEGESFWSVVYPRFMARDLTRDDLRTIVQIGLRQTNGNYRLMTQLFNMPDDTYKRFLGFLRKHECHIPFQSFRVAPARVTTARDEIKDVGVA